MKTGIFAALIAAPLAWAPAAQAASIAIVNAGFEDAFTDSSQTTPYDLPDGNYTQGFGTALVVPSGGTPFFPGWDSGNPFVGAQDATPTNFTTFGATQGENFAYINDGLLTQTLSATLTQTTYTFTALLGARLEGSAAFGTTHMDLLAGGVLLTPTTSVDPTPVRGTFALWTQTYVIDGSNPRLGQTLSLQFYQDKDQPGFNQSDVDNVALSTFEAAPVPEPASLGLLGLAGLGLLGRRRR
jgi:hypothetical protein